MAKLRGVISNVPLAMTKEEVKKEIRGGKVLDIRRLRTNKDDVKKDSPSMLVHFESSLSKEIKVGWMNYRVKECIPNTIRCCNCQRIGHVSPTVPRGEHDFSKCAKDTKLRCCNCGGEHSAVFRRCAVHIKAKEVQKHNVINNISYAEALKRVNGKMQSTVTYKEVTSGKESRPCGGLRALPQRTSRPRMQQ